MALYTVTTGKVTLTESATKSLVLIKPEKVSVTLRQIEISMGAKEASEEVQFELYRVETTNAEAGTEPTPQPTQEWFGAATSKVLTVLSKEPTAVKGITSYMVQPLGGLFIYTFPYGAEVGTKLNGANIGLRYTTPATVKPSCVATLWFEE